MKKYFEIYDLDLWLDTKNNLLLMRFPMLKKVSFCVAVRTDNF